MCKYQTIHMMLCVQMLQVIYDINDIMNAGIELCRVIMNIKYMTNV